MGGFYGSTQVRGVERATVKRVADEMARERRIRCLIGPEINGWVGVYPENHGQDETVGEAIAKVLGADVLHLVVHDDDIFAYWYWRAGQLADSYWSRPGYFGDEHRAQQETMSGNPEVFESIAPNKAEKLRSLLERGDGRFLVEMERLEAFAKLLRIENSVSAFEYIKDGEGGVKRRRDFDEVPADVVEAARTKEREERQRQRKEAAERKKRLKRDGVLLAEHVEKGQVPRVCAVRGGFLLAWHGSEPPRFEFRQAPWSDAVKLNIAIRDGELVNSLASDSSGERVAASLGRRYVVFDVATWQVVREIPEDDWGIGVGMSDDGLLMAHSSRKMIGVTEVESGTRLMASLQASGQELKFDPSARLVGVVEGSFELFDVRTGASRLKVSVEGQLPLPPQYKQAVLQSVSELDLAEAEQAWHAQAEASAKELEAMVAKLKLTPEQNAEMFARAREESAKAWERTREKILQMKAGDVESWLRSGERIGTAGFTSDGKWLWCGTDQGFRVFSFSALLESEPGRITHPTWKYSFGLTEHQGGVPANYVYAAVEDRDPVAMVFVGYDGRVRRMDLQSGEVRELLSAPELGPVIMMALSQDRRTLATVTRPGLTIVRGKRDERCLVHIWNYEALKRRAYS